MVMKNDVKEQLIFIPSFTITVLQYLTLLLAVVRHYRRTVLLQVRLKSP